MNLALRLWYIFWNTSPDQTIFNVQMRCIFFPCCGMTSISEFSVQPDLPNVNSTHVLKGLIDPLAEVSFSLTDVKYRKTG